MELFSAGVVTDDQPTSCISFNDWGEGIVDLIEEYEFPGDLLIWADVRCCDGDVDQETPSWGDIKNLYR